MKGVKSLSDQIEDLAVKIFGKMDYDMPDDIFLKVLEKVHFKERLTRAHCEYIHTPRFNVNDASVYVSSKNWYVEIFATEETVLYEEFEAFPDYKYDPDRKLLWFADIEMKIERMLDFNFLFCALRYAKIKQQEGYKPYRKIENTAEKPFYVNNVIRDKNGLFFQREFSAFMLRYARDAKTLDTIIPSVAFSSYDKYGDIQAQGTGNIQLHIGTTVYYEKMLMDWYSLAKKDKRNVPRILFEDANFPYNFPYVEAEIISSAYIDNYITSKTRPATVFLGLPRNIVLYGNIENKTLHVYKSGSPRIEDIQFVFTTVQDYYNMAERLLAISDNFSKAFDIFLKSIPSADHPLKGVDLSIHGKEKSQLTNKQKNDNREDLINSLIARQTICQGKMCGTFRDGIEVSMDGVGVVRIARYDLGNSDPVSQLARVFLDRDIRFIITQHRTNSKIVHGSCRLIAENEIEKMKLVPEGTINVGSIIKGVVRYIRLDCVSVQFRNQLIYVDNHKLQNPQKVSVGDVLTFIIEAVSKNDSHYPVMKIRETPQEYVSERTNSQTANKETHLLSNTNCSNKETSSLIRAEFLKYALIANSVVKEVTKHKVLEINGMDGAQILSLCVLHFLGILSLSDGKISDSEINFVSDLLGANVPQQALLNAAHNNSYKTAIFHIMLVFDKLAKASELEANTPLSVAYYHFFQFLGIEYLKKFNTAAKNHAYNQYMKDIHKLIISKGNNATLVYSPYKPGYSSMHENKIDLQKDPKHNDPKEGVSKNNQQDALKELNELIGLRSIKQDVTELLGLVKAMKIRERRGLPTIPVSLHLVFTGNPGTGKTTVARILGQLYKEIGVLKTGQMVEVDRSDLVAGYVGQTAIKTQKKIKEAIGGILFIDEAYTLVKEGNDFGQEAIDTLLKEMEDHRGEFVVIVAGYSEPMKAFINSNPGLKSRFNKYFEFPDYSVTELIQIFSVMCSKYDYHITEGAGVIVSEKIKEIERNKGTNFANARDVRNYFERIITRQANRIAQLTNVTDEDLTQIVIEDVE